MRETTDNTNELDSYGVWVKRPPQDENEEKTLSGSDDFSLPDFNESQLVDENAIKADDDFSAIPFPEPVDESELQNASNNSEAFDVNPESFSTSEIPDFSSKQDGEESIDIDSFTGDSAGDSDSMEEIDLDSFGDFDSDSPSSGESEVSLDDFLGGDSGSSEEISLDDFLDTDSFDTGSKAQKEDDVSNDEALDINLDFNESEEDQVPTVEILEEAEYEENQFDEEEESPKAEEKVQVSQDLGPMEEVSLDDFSLDESDAATADAAAAAVQAQAGSEEVSLDEFGIDSEAGESPVTDNVRKAKKTVVDYDLAITEDDEVTSAPSIKEIKTDPKQEDKETSTENTAVNNELLEQIIHDLSGLKNEISALKNDLAVLKDKSSFEKEPGFPGAEETSADVLERAEEELGGFFGTSDEDDTIALSGDELSNIMNTADFTEEVAGESISEEADMAPLTEEVSESSASDQVQEEIPEAVSEESENIEETASSPLDAAFVAENTEIPSFEDTISDDFTDDTQPALSEEGLAEDQIDTFEESVLDEDELKVQEESTDQAAEDSSFDDIADNLVSDDIFEENIESIEDTSAETPLETENQDTEVINEPVLEEEGSVVPMVSEDEIEENGEIQPEEEKLAEESIGDTLVEDSAFEDPFANDILDDTRAEESSEDSLPEEIDIPKVDDIAADEDTAVENDDILVESSNSDFMDSVRAEEDVIGDEELEDVSEEEVPEVLPEEDMFDIQIEEPEPAEPVLSEENVMDDLMG